MDSKQIVHNYKGEERAGTFRIADGFNRRHDRIIKHIKEYLEIFLSMEKTYGRIEPEVPIRKVKTKGRSIQEYLLNQTQVVFLGTLFRTASKKKDDPVLLFKARLAKEFVALKNRNLAFDQHKQQPTYQITRDAGKIVRKQTTDGMQKFVEYAATQGSKTPKTYYINITKMMNGLLFIIEGKFKNLRNVMTIQQLMTVSSAEQIIDRGLKDGMSRKKYYKDIYQDVKKRVMTFAELHGQSKVIEDCLRIEQK